METISTGEKQLDAIIQGIRYRQLVAIAGDSQTGKTWLVDTLFHSAYEKGFNIVHISKHAAQKDYKNIPSIPMDDFRIFGDDEDDKGCYLLLANSLDLPSLMATLNQIDKDPGFDLLLIDDLSILDGGEMVEDCNWQVQELKNLAKDKDFSVVLTTRLPRDDWWRFRTEAPNLDDLKRVFYPGIADVVILLHDTGVRSELGDRTIKAMVAKNNAGNTGEYDYIIERGFRAV